MQKWLKIVHLDKLKLVAYIDIFIFFIPNSKYHHLSDAGLVSFWKEINCHRLFCAEDTFLTRLTNISWSLHLNEMDLSSILKDIQSFTQFEVIQGQSSISNLEMFKSPAKFNTYHWYSSKCCFSFWILSIFSYESNSRIANVNLFCSIISLSVHHRLFFLEIVKLRR